MGVPTGFTAESNNMTLGALPCQVLSTPGISFVEGVAPKIISISPSIGDENGGTQVTINGEGLSPNGEVAFGTTFVGVSSCQSSSQCTVFSPPGSAPVHMGYVNLADGSPGPESNLVAFKFAPFPNGTMSPSKGPTSGGTHVTVNGRNFATAPRATTITFDLNGVATPALDVACSSDTSCTLITPPPNEPGVDPIVAPVSITVGGETAQLGSFTYTDNGPPPTPNRGCQPGDCVGEKCCTIFNSDGNVIGKRCIPANRFCPVQN